MAQGYLGIMVKTKEVWWKHTNIPLYLNAEDINFIKILCVQCKQPFMVNRDPTVKVPRCSRCRSRKWESMPGESLEL